ncbi:MAG: class I SAM-dependent DNA methyltransferase [Chloroflexota bacterium]
MNEYTASTYGDRIADVYEEIYRVPGDPAAAVEMLAGLAGDGRALELGVGTGRVALPLRERGIEVHGIDASEAMLARMRAKPGGSEVAVTVGDFADVAADGDFSLIFVVANTFYGLLSQEEQIRCFRNVADHLQAGGAFVIEAFVPDVARFSRQQHVAANVELDWVRLDVTNHDPVDQKLYSQHVALSAEGVKLYPVQLRYAWPAELDLMAQLAGMRLRERWADWDRSKFNAASTNHVSVYEHAT